MHGWLLSTHKLESDASLPSKGNMCVEHTPVSLVPRSGLRDYMCVPSKGAPEPQPTSAHLRGEKMSHLRGEKMSGS